MRLFSRLGLFAVMVVSSFNFLTESADAQLFPIFKCRKKACCVEPAPEPVCCPAAEEPEPCPEPEPEPVCCPAPEPAPEPVCCPEPAPEPEPVCCPAPAEPEPAPCCCSTAPAAAPAADVAATDTYGMPELAEGETLVSISPIEVPTDAAETMTSATE